MWVAALAATVAAFGMPVQSGHDLFQQALVKERAEGNLQDAIDLYDRIVQDFSEDHALAARLAGGLENLGARAGPCETNIVNARLPEGRVAAPEFVERIGGEGIRALALGPRDVRFVTHRDVDGPDVDRALEAAARALA